MLYCLCITKRKIKLFTKDKECLELNEKIKLKIRESLSSILPVSLIIIALSFTITPLPVDIISQFFVGAALLIVGMGLFTLGAEVSMSVIGERVGANIAKNKNILSIFIILFILGTIITLAEPDLKILASQISAIPENITIIAVSVGVGLFLVIAFLRIIFKINISWLLFIFYLITFILATFVPKDFWAIAFDSGGVTTGPITVPFIIALGIGAASVRGNKDSENDSFGLVALCSIGPIITVLILGLLYKISDVAYSTHSFATLSNSIEIANAFITAFPTYFKEVVLALFPIIVFFMIYQAFALKLPKKELIKILVGSLYTFVGLVLFLVGVNVGFLPAAYLLGSEIANLNYNWIAIPIGMLIGYYIVIAEPAVIILVKQISDITDGAIPEKAMKFNLSISIALAVGLAMLRVLTGIPIMYFLIPGYAIALLLSIFTPKIFTSIAFDSGGVATGPVTTTFLIPFLIGICTSLGGNILTDAFGVVAMVAMTPLISIQISGLIYKLKLNKAKKLSTSSEEQKIVNIDWEWENCLN